MMCVWEGEEVQSKQGCSQPPFPHRHPLRNPAPPRPLGTCNSPLSCCVVIIAECMQSDNDITINRVPVQQLGEV